ncbi:MAG: prepilin-type N-terminal cleavage/methylation domain-containing protein [Verrucomicrobia bacterium]|nr:prepilin-type N-terminal cleavage/methylation domain-containing protein [Verrucomicrobiota bacterium]
MSPHRARKSGFTLVELAVAVLLFGLVVGGLCTTFLMGRVATYRARHQIQASLLLQAKLEELRAGSYEDVLDWGPVNVVLDPGRDIEWGTDDDLTGEIQVEVLDLIDLDGDGEKDTCKLVRVTLTWQSYSLGGERTLSVFLDTLIAKR